jgi:hypothetical protein
MRQSRLGTVAATTLLHLHSTPSVLARHVAVNFCRDVLKKHEGARQSQEKWAYLMSASRARHALRDEQKISESLNAARGGRGAAPLTRFSQDLLFDGLW